LKYGFHIIETSIIKSSGNKLLTRFESPQKRLQIASKEWWSFNLEACNINSSFDLGKCIKIWYYACCIHSIWW